jgi:hypothetical protein
MVLLEKLLWNFFIHVAPEPRYAFYCSGAHRELSLKCDE